MICSVIEFYCVGLFKPNRIRIDCGTGPRGFDFVGEKIIFTALVVVFFFFFFIQSRPSGGKKITGARKHAPPGYIFFDDCNYQVCMVYVKKLSRSVWPSPDGPE